MVVNTVSFCHEISRRRYDRKGEMNMLYLYLVSLAKGIMPFGWSVWPGHPPDNDNTK